MSYREAPTGSVLAWLKEQFEGKEVKDSRSPAGNWMELRVESLEQGNAVLLMTVRHEMTNPYGNIHGGMMSLVIDEAIGWAVISLDLDTHFTSLSLNVDFLYAIKEGDQLRAKSRVVRQGKKILHVACEVYDMKDVLLATASSNLIVTSMKIKEE